MAIKQHVTLEKEKNRIVFNADEMAKDINSIIAKFRNFVNETPVIGGEAGKYIKKKTPGPTVVNTSVKLVFRDNTFNYKKMRFEAKNRRNLANRSMNAMINRQLDKQEQKIKKAATEKAVNYSANALSNLLLNFIAIYLQNKFTHLQLPAPIKLKIAQRLSGVITDKLLGYVN